MVLQATGGDNSNSAEGNFYEGYMATGYTVSTRVFGFYTKM